MFKYTPEQRAEIVEELTKRASKTYRNRYESKLKDFLNTFNDSEAESPTTEDISSKTEAGAVNAMIGPMRLDTPNVANRGVGPALTNPK